MVEDIHAAVGEHVAVWPWEQYTAANLFGAEGTAIVKEAAQRAQEAGQDFVALLEEWQNSSKRRFARVVGRLSCRDACCRVKAGSGDDARGVQEGFVF